MFKSLAAGAALVACLALASIQMSRAADPAPAPQATVGIAVITPTTGNTVHGVVHFTEVDGGVNVVADLDGLPPGDHGFHIHEWGDTTDVDKAMSEGAHYDPEMTHHHGLPGSTDPHQAGDMGNITADANGHAHFEMMFPKLTLMGPTDPIVGRSVIIHAKVDDGSQPTGNAGARIGFGVIGIAKPG